MALKKLTTAESRGFAFGVQYAVFNFAVHRRGALSITWPRWLGCPPFTPQWPSGALADLSADLLRSREYLLPGYGPRPGASAERARSCEMARFV